MIKLDEYVKLRNSNLTDERRTECELDITDENEARKWLFQENIRLEQYKSRLEQEKAQLEQLKKNFQLEQNKVQRQNRVIKQQLEQEKRLFEMKWKVLEGELRQLASDRTRMDREREELNAIKASRPINDFQYSMFFVGVTNRLMLKKRYKDLLKIFHPDNVAGDHETVQEINREYEELKQIFV